MMETAEGIEVAVTVDKAYLSFWAGLSAPRLRLDLSTQCAKAPGTTLLSVTGYEDSLWTFTAQH